MVHCRLKLGLDITDARRRGVSRVCRPRQSARGNGPDGGRILDHIVPGLSLQNRCAGIQRGCGSIRSVCVGLGDNDICDSGVKIRNGLRLLLLR